MRPDKSRRLQNGSREFPKRGKEFWSRRFPVDHATRERNDLLLLDTRSFAHGTPAGQLGFHVIPEAVDRGRRRNGSCLQQPIHHDRIRHDLLERCIEFCNDRLGRAGWSDKSVPCCHFIIRQQSGFDGGRHIRYRWIALTPGHGEGAQLSALHRTQHRRHGGRCAFPSPPTSRRANCEKVREAC